MPETRRLRLRLLAAAALAGGVAAASGAGAAGAVSAADGRGDVAASGVTLRDTPVPPAAPLTVGQARERGGRLANSPITGATGVVGEVVDPPPPSLETLMSARPGTDPESKIKPDRAAVLHDAAVSYGAAGGLAARTWTINRMLERREAELDKTYDFGPLLVQLSPHVLLQPPVVTEAQMAGALGEEGLTARETRAVYRITRRARLVSGEPNWRIYLVQPVIEPIPPVDDARPATGDEVVAWNRWVAEGWAMGEAQAVDVFRSDLGQLQRDIVGMARYGVLLRAGLVERPRAALAYVRAQGGGDVLRVGDTAIRLRPGRGLVADPRRWKPGQLAPGGMAPTP